MKCWLMSGMGHSRPTHSRPGPLDVRFSNRPSGVKHFQTVHHCNVDVTHGLALLSGIGTRALPSWDPRTRRNNLLGGLGVNVTAGPSAEFVCLVSEGEALEAVTTDLETSSSTEQWKDVPRGTMDEGLTPDG